MGHWGKENLLCLVSNSTKHAVSKNACASPTFLGCVAVEDEGLGGMVLSLEVRIDQNQLT